MPGIRMLAFTDANPIEGEEAMKIVEIVHRVIYEITGEKSSHSDYSYVPRGPHDFSCFVSSRNGVFFEYDITGNDYILVVDAKKTKVTKRQSKRDEIRKEIKKRVVELLDLNPGRFAVRYRVFDSSFG